MKPIKKKSDNLLTGCALNWISQEKPISVIEDTLSYSQMRRKFQWGILKSHLIQLPPVPFSFDWLCKLVDFFIYSAII